MRDRETFAPTCGEAPPSHPTGNHTNRRCKQHLCDRSKRIRLWPICVSGISCDESAASRIAHGTAYVTHLMACVSSGPRAVMPGNACAGIHKPPDTALCRSFPTRFGQSRMTRHTQCAGNTLADGVVSGIPTTGHTCRPTTLLLPTLTVRPASAEGMHHCRRHMLAYNSWFVRWCKLLTLTGHPA